MFKVKQSVNKQKKNFFKKDFLKQYPLNEDFSYSKDNFKFCGLTKKDIWRLLDWDTLKC